MKKDIVVIVCVFLVSAIFIFHSCAERNEKEEFRRTYKESCEQCGERCTDKYKTYDDYFLCADCAVGYTMCKDCKLLYKHKRYIRDDMEGIFYDYDGTESFCEDCADRNTLYCCLCGNNRFEKENMVTFVDEDKTWYMCTSCATSYFMNVENIKRCFYCNVCRQLSCKTAYKHSHFLSDYLEEIVCEDCVNKYGYMECTQCKRYSDKITDGVCYYCNRKNNEQ